ncbi:hypothetical protein SKAU_G00146610 [Synaphobranchus kaupii]|uniref:Uncharacterized protein n=1 Tax=Synaphobranchus kaupii TaxID=118154 RepID=A0A9Q1FTC5_SYNKA|nr:hypothetical protein SKAU_G00146610 [Synaphobranchus kaupii]
MMGSRKTQCTADERSSSGQTTGAWRSPASFLNSNPASLCFQQCTYFSQSESPEHPPRGLWESEAWADSLRRAHIVTTRLLLETYAIEPALPTRHTLPPLLGLFRFLNARLDRSPGDTGEEDPPSLRVRSSTAAQNGRCCPCRFGYNNRMRMDHAAEGDIYMYSRIQGYRGEGGNALH